MSKKKKGLTGVLLSFGLGLVKGATSDNPAGKSRGSGL